MQYVRWKRQPYGCLNSQHLLGCLSKLRLGALPSGSLSSPSLLLGQCGGSASQLCNSVDGEFLHLEYPAQAVPAILHLRLIGVLAPGRAAPVLERFGDVSDGAKPASQDQSLKSLLCAGLQ